MGCKYLSVSSTKHRDELLSVPRDRVRCVDTETTGLNPQSDEILQVSICDGNGTLLYSSYIRPERRRRWPDAEKVNGISWDMVSECPTLIDESDEIELVLFGADLLVGYNLDFDVDMLLAGRVNIPHCTRYDVMNDASVLNGKWNEYYGDYTYISLKKAAQRYSIDFEAHDSSQDAIATMKVFYAMLESEEMAAELAFKDKVNRQLEDEKKAEERRVAEEQAKAEAEQAERAKRSTIFVVVSTIAATLAGLMLMILMNTCGR